MDGAKKIFAICGEFSGEMHLAKVISSLKDIAPDTEIRGMASSLCKQAGMSLVEDYKNFSFAGVTQVLTNLPKILSLKQRIVKAIIDFAPDVLLLVDYAGFNTQVARAVKEAQSLNESLAKTKIIQYIAPQIWGFASLPHQKYY